MNTQDAPADLAGSHLIGGGEAPKLPPVSIAEMVARHVALTWPEAIAIVAETCRLVVEAAPTATQVPEPARLLIFPDGSMGIGAWRGEVELSSLARTLHDLLAGAQPPTPLRLFVGHAISSDKFASVREFGEALSYYERPGRAELIQSAFQRFLLTPVDAPPPPPAPVEDNASDERARDTSPSQRRTMAGRTMAIAVFLLVFAGGLMLGLRFLAARPASAGSPTLQSVTAQATTELAQLKDKLRGLGLPIPEATAPPTEAPPEVVPPPVAPRRAVSRAASVAAGSAPSSRRSGIAPGPTPAEVVGQTPDALPAPNPPVAVEDVEDVNVYTNQSAGVSPPVVMDARVLPSNFQVTGSSTQNQMELIIGPDGHVEQVRMLSRLERLPDMMLLSGAKSWLFKPAMKNGRPVRYRLPVTWTVSSQ